MTSTDISRLLLQPKKHYAGARLQQGRVLIDSDFNEEAQLDDEEQRRILGDVIGPTGSPDEGFAVDLALGDEVIPQAISYNGGPAVDVLPYRLKPGALYVGGLRFVQEQREIGGLAGGEVVALQREHLQMGPGDAPLAQPGVTHSQFVYLHAWEQCVTATEDEELRERALGGLDTSTRVRRMAQVLVDEVENGGDCLAAWTTVRQRIENATGGAFDAHGVRLRSSARLRLAFAPGEALDACAPCSPDDPGRYLGANNQAIRIMLVAADRYVWAFDNASPVYRVRLGEPSGGSVRVEMLTEPRDEAHWPLRNSVVEFLPWGALLDNGQKVAQEPGAFLRVDDGFDPDDGSFGLTAADALQLQALTAEWDAAHPDRPQLPNDNDPNGRYFYLRMWHRLDDEADPVLLDVAGPHTLLLRQGLDPQFTGAGNPGDYWVAALRPNTPHVIVPWDLTQTGGVEPHGPAHYYTPLSLITFRPPQAGEHANAEVVEAVSDCRQRFRPLVDRDGCCTHTVGDGVTSIGDYSSIQDAVDNLPQEGGKVCVLPGTYAEEVLVRWDDVTIEGCGPQTHIVSPAGESAASALILVRAANFTLRKLTLSTNGQVGVLVEEAPEGSAARSGVTIDDVRISADQRAGLGGHTRSCISLQRVADAVVRNCRLSMDGSLSDDATAFVRGSNILVEGCRLESLPADGSTSSCWGGLQIGGGSQHVTVRRNRIAGGVGHGITLGSLIWVSETTRRTDLGAGAGLQDTQDPCAPTVATVQPIEVEEVRFDAETAGDLGDLWIVDNTIERMAANGISTLTMLPLAEEGATDRITTDRLWIERNRIFDNVDQSTSLRERSPVSKVKKLEPGEEEAFGQFVVSQIPPAGIALVDGEYITIRDNEIRDNGTGSPEQISGVSILYGNGIVIESNRIQNNGLRQSGTLPIADPTRAGVFVSLAGIASDQPNPDQADPLGSSLRIIGNVVEHPNGGALAVRATGPVVVEGNYLLSQGNNATSQQPGVAQAVKIANIGPPWESVDLQPGEPAPSRWLMPERTPEYLQRDSTPSGAEARLGQGGRVLFNNNHVTLNWTEPSNVSAGLATGFSVGICSLDDVVCHGNQFALNVEDPGLKKSAGGGSLGRQPRISAHVVVVGATANSSHNRVSEGVNDAMISLLTLGGLLVSSTGNATTHMSFASTCNTFTPNSDQPPSAAPDERVDRNNLVWLRPAAETSRSDLVSLSTVRATANQLFATLCNSCLGLPVGEAQTFTFQAFATMFARGNFDG
ncbi:MAG: hypothetical protein GC160_19800 [Acidobacteria bacterium]|nr:hypothetical protein [Acidobacteriota bacterium]